MNDILPVNGEPSKIIAEMMKVSNNRARQLISQGAIDVTRNGDTRRFMDDDVFCANDIIRVGKGRFFQIVKVGDRAMFRQI